ncbi:MAG: hypothetical protein AMS25_00780 [Gemmatimonas sp. SM23_52]|nr:MAG: hypothetical protein AMS25_00780 [Gemmatimonas sp. SM23_52]
MKTSHMLATVALVIIGITCARIGEDRVATSEDDMVAVARMLVSLDRIAAEEDLEEFLSYVADDAVFMPPDEPAIVGVQAIAAWYRNAYHQVDFEMTHEPLEVDAAGDHIIHRGNATGTMTPEGGGEPIPLDNKYLMVLKKQPDGSLKLWRACFNSNAPPPTR